MPRIGPPKGKYDVKGARAYLMQRGIDISEAMIYRYTDEGKIAKSGKWYIAANLEAFIRWKHGDPIVEPPTEATFAQATFADMVWITDIATKLFSTTITPIPALTRQQWLFKEPRGHYVVKKQDGRVVAYIHIVAVRDEWAERYIRGEVYGRHLTGEDVLKLEPGIPLTCIVLSIGTDPDIESQSVKSHYVSVLLRGIEKELEQLGKEGIIISRLYAFSETKDGKSLCLHMGMQSLGYPQKHRINFVMEPLQAQVPFLRRYQANIRRWMQEHKIDSGSDRATMGEKGLVVDESTKTQESTTKSSYTRRRQQEDTIPSGCISMTDMYQDHGVKESSAYHGIEDGAFSVRKGSWYARGRVVKSILDRANQRGFVAYVKTLPGYHRCEDANCPCHELG